MNKIFSLFLDLIFPKFCLGCKTEGVWLCPVCQKKILVISTQTCPGCKKISRTGRYCPQCRRGASISGIIVAAYYEEGPIKELIHNFKYNHIVELKNILGNLLAQALKNNIDDLGKDILITAVPIHFLRRARRGYNQAEILAEEVASELKIPKNFNIIKKIRKTLPQVKTEGKVRRKNVINSFGIFDKAAVANRNIVIVDDVTTTGATLNECGRILKEAGAKKVWGLVVAKG